MNWFVWCIQRRSQHLSGKWSCLKAITTLLMLHLSGSSYITGEDTLQDDCDITAIFHQGKYNLNTKNIQDLLLFMEYWKHYNWELIHNTLIILKFIDHDKTGKSNWLAYCIFSVWHVRYAITCCLMVMPSGFQNGIEINVQCIN